MMIAFFSSGYKKFGNSRYAENQSSSHLFGSMHFVCLKQELEAFLASQASQLINLLCLLLRHNLG